MSTYTSDIYRRIQEDTGYSTAVIRHVCRAFQSNILWAMEKDADHRVVLTSFMEIALKPATKYHSLKHKSSTPYTMKICAHLSRTLGNKISASGYQQAVEDVWGRRPEFVMGVKKYVR